jgi:asparagine synthase (glutamine-hydrolysing)
MRGVLPPEEVHTLTEGSASFDPFEYAASAVHLNGMEPCRAISLLESRIYMHNQLLRDTDTMSMAHSLEVRVPYLDASVVDVAARCAQGLAGGSKRVLVEARSLYFPVGEDRGPKRGFTFPFERWLAGPMGDEIREGADADTILSKNAVSDLWNGYLHGRRHWSAVWAVVVLQRWLHAHRVTAG